MADEQEKQTKKGRNGSFEVPPQVANRAKSFEALVAYCENVRACRHHLICQYFGEQIVPICDYACDWHKDKAALAKAKELGLATEEWCSTQREMGAYATYDYE